MVLPKPNDTKRTHCNFKKQKIQKTLYEKI